MKIRYLKLKDWLLMTVLGLFGLTACHSTKEVVTNPTDTLVPPPDDPIVEKPEPRDPVVVMYGVPTMNFVVKGQVVDEQNKPVPGMQVVLVNQRIDIEPGRMDESHPYVQQYLKESSDTTDANGQYQVTTRDVPADRQQIIVRDIDGEKNGSYEDQMFDVDFTQGEQTQPRQGWNMGTLERKLTITVNRK